MERWQKPEAEHPCSSTNDDGPTSRSSFDYSTPLRSVRGNAVASPSPFYKLSSELSRESLRIPGTVPFTWEQSPGRRKISNTVLLASLTPVQGKPALPKISTQFVATDLAKPSLADLFQQPHLEGDGAVPTTSPSPVKSQLPQIAHPPAMEHPRLSSARYSTMQRNVPASSSITPKSAFHDEFADAVSDSASDAITATAGGFSVDDSLMVSGPLRPTSTPSEARDFIMHRFLPAAHTIACESPQTPSRRFLPLGISAGPTPSRCNGSFRDYGGITCTESSQGEPRCKTTNPLQYASPLSMPTPRRQHLEGSFRSTIDDFDDIESEKDEEEPPFIAKACGIFPFRIHISIHSRHSNNRSSSSSKHHRHKNQQPHKKSNKPVRCLQTPKRIMDVLHEDQSSGYEDESPVHQYQSRNFVAERERNRIAASKQTAMHACGDHCPRPLYSIERYYKESPQLHQNGAMQRSLSDLNNEEACDYGSFYDVPSRFCSPSPAAIHLANARASQANMLSNLMATPQRTTSSMRLIEGNPHPALSCTTEQHLLNSSLCHYNMHTTHHFCHPQAASPCSCLTPPPSHVSSSQDSNTAIDNITKVINPDPVAFAGLHHSQQTTHIINNALYEEDQETASSSGASHPSMLTSYVTPPTSHGTKINHGSKTQAENAMWHAYANGDVNARNHAENSMKNNEHIRSNVGHHVRDGNLHGNDYVSNGHEGQHEHKGDTHYANDGDMHACNGMCNHNAGNGVQYACNHIHCVGNDGDMHACNGMCNHNACNGVQYACNHIHCVGNGGRHACHGSHYVCDRNHAMGVRNAINGESNGDMQMGINGFSSSILTPPLPKSPTHSWLDKAIAPAVNKSPNQRSRFCYLHSKGKVLAAAAEDGPLEGKETPPPPPAADSKWEALVKGSHLQPGHLRFSKELFHQSQTTVSGTS